MEQSFRSGINTKEHKRYISYDADSGKVTFGDLDPADNDRLSYLETQHCK